MPNQDLIEILLVEDSEDDIFFTQKAFEGGKLCNPLHVVKDGVEAMAFLRKQGKYAEVPTPDLILLDLNMPKKDGREVLNEVKQDPNLLKIPIIVLTTSEALADIDQVYQLHGNCYITKPVDFEKFMTVVHSIENFWLSIIKRPKK